MMGSWTWIGDVVQDYKYRQAVRRRLREMHRRAARMGELRETREQRWIGHDAASCEYCRPVRRSDKAY